MATSKQSIYVIQSPIDHSIRYVGVTKNLSNRTGQHLQRKKSQKHKHLPLYCWMRKLNLSPVFTVVQSFDGLCKKDLELAEIYWISYFKSIGCALLNCTDGGGLMNPSIEVREKISRAKKALYKEHPEKNPFYGWYPTHKPFKCIETGKKFNHTRQAAKEMKLDRASICRILKGKQKTTDGYSFKYLNNSQ